MLLSCGHLDTQVCKEMKKPYLLANTGSAHEFYGPEPALPIAKSVVKKSIRDWVAESKELYWRNITYAKHTKAFRHSLQLAFRESSCAY